MAHKKIEEVTDEFWDEVVNETNKELIEDFLNQQHLSPATLKQYESALKIFAKWIYDNYYSKKDGEEKIIPELKPRDALKYQNWLISKDLSSNAIKFKRSVVSSLCGFIEVYYNDEYPNFRNIYTKAIPSVSKELSKEKIPLTLKEYETIKKELKKRQEWQKLAYLIFSYESGCRREECRQVLKEVASYNKVSDKEGNEKNYYATHNIRAKGKGKTGKVRKFTFNQEAMDAIKKWVEYRSTLVEDDNCEYLFVSKTKDGFKQVSPNTFNNWCKEFSKYIGGKHVRPHLIRTSRATIASEEGTDIKKIQKLLGHNSSQTTEIYIIKDDNDDLDDLY